MTEFFLDITNSLNLSLMSYRLRYLDIMIDYSPVIISICDELWHSCIGRFNYLISLARGPTTKTNFSSTDINQNEVSENDLGLLNDSKLMRYPIDNSPILCSRLYTETQGIGDILQWVSRITRSSTTAQRLRNSVNSYPESCSWWGWEWWIEEGWRSSSGDRRWAEDEAGTRGVADGRWLGRLDGQKERKRGLAQPARSLGGGRS